jgi:hypothetical protein
MNNEIALSLLHAALAEYRALTYEELAQRAAADDHRDVTGPDGRTYQVEVQVIREGRGPGPLHVVGTVDDGGWRAFLPLHVGFMVRLDGTRTG